MGCFIYQVIAIATAMILGVCLLLWRTHEWRVRTYIEGWFVLEWPPVPMSKIRKWFRHERI